MKVLYSHHGMKGKNGWGRTFYMAQGLADLGHDVTREQVWELFRHYSKSARIIEIKSDEFDDVCYFEDGNPDSYLYCVKFDEGHAFYHRFLKEDFEELFGEASRMKGAR